MSLMSQVSDPQTSMGIRLTSRAGENTVVRPHTLDFLVWKVRSETQEFAFLPHYRAMLTLQACDHSLGSTVMSIQGPVETASRGIIEPGRSLCFPTIKLQPNRKINRRGRDSRPRLNPKQPEFSCDAQDLRLMAAILV